MVAELKTQDAKQSALDLEVIGQSVKGRDLYLVKYISDPSNPTILFLTQQHGNEQLTTEGTLEVIKHLGSGRMKDVLKDINILVVPMLNPDGAMGDVNFSLDDYIALGIVISPVTTPTTWTSTVVTLPRPSPKSRPCTTMCSMPSISIT